MSDNVLQLLDNVLQVFDGDEIEWTIIAITMLATLAPKLQKVKNNIDIVHDVRKVAAAHWSKECELDFCGASHR